MLSKPLLFIICASILLVGCVDISIEQRLHRDNTVDMSISFSGEERVISGFTNMTVNPAIASSASYEESEGSITYSFTKIPSGTNLFQLEAGKDASFFGVESYTLEKTFRFPYYYYTYTLTPGNALPEDQGEQARAMLSTLKMTYVVQTFGPITTTNGVLTDSKKVTFTLDPTSTQAHTIEFKDFFLKDWFS